MTELKRKVGRPRKTPAAIVSVKDTGDCVKQFNSYAELKTWMDEQEEIVKEIGIVSSNPDTEPATKGYVKCLLRKTRDHTHAQRIEWNWVGAAAIIGWMGLAMIYIVTHTTGASQFPPEWWAAITMFTFACTLVAMDLDTAGDNQTDSVDGKEPTVLREHCKPDKKKCE